MLQSVFFHDLVIQHHFFRDDGTASVEQSLLVAILCGFPDERAKSSMIRQAMHDFVCLGGFVSDFRDQE